MYLSLIKVDCPATAAALLRMLRRTETPQLFEKASDRVVSVEVPSIERVSLIETSCTSQFLLRDSNIESRVHTRREEEAGALTGDLVREIFPHLSRCIPQMRNFHAVQLHGRSGDVVRQVNDKLNQQPRKTRSLQKSERQAWIAQRS